MNGHKCDTELMNMDTQNEYGHPKFSFQVLGVQNINIFL